MQRIRPTSFSNRAGSMPDLSTHPPQWQPRSYCLLPCAARTPCPESMHKSWKLSTVCSHSTLSHVQNCHMTRPRRFTLHQQPAMLWGPAVDTLEMIVQASGYGAGDSILRESTAIIDRDWDPHDTTQAQGGILSGIDTHKLFCGKPRAFLISLAR